MSRRSLLRGYLLPLWVPRMSVGVPTSFDRLSLIMGQSPAMPSHHESPSLRSVGSVGLVTPGVSVAGKSTLAHLPQEQDFSPSRRQALLASAATTTALRPCPWFMSRGLWASCSQVLWAYSPLECKHRKVLASMDENFNQSLNSTISPALRSQGLLPPRPC